MDEEPVIIKLTHDQAFVLSDWFYEVMMQSDKLDAIVPDRAAGHFWHMYPFGDESGGTPGGTEKA
ncbi:hypothetical protein [Streptomyces sp. H39-S7]|uniref:hypothetical protein n=1 Tax=Streptomyces sp. H39-S7 TaxID=3004357 RepID=UPI0022B02B1F|nr:hypothetical protein [Streptomyces sp. H39-S7]MCZ4125272.1 hypothetical protein [Streptomyces sp. H39-S7]